MSKVIAELCFPFKIAEDILEWSVVLGKVGLCDLCDVVFECVDFQSLLISWCI